MLFYLLDDRIINVPLNNFPSIHQLSNKQREDWYITDGQMFSFEESDEIFNNKLKLFKDNYKMSLDEAIKELELEKLRNEERDRIRGEEREKTMQEIVKNHLHSNKFSIEDISQITGTSEVFVIKVQNEFMI